MKSILLHNVGGASSPAKGSEVENPDSGDPAFGSGAMERLLQLIRAYLQQECPLITFLFPVMAIYEFCHMFKIGRMLNGVF
jgi:hypothetical protein